MKRVRISSGRGHYRDITIPETFAEGHAMLVDAMNPKYDVSGGDAYRNAVAGRVAFGLFGRESLAPNPTTALNYLLQKLCEVPDEDDPVPAGQDPAAGQ